MPARCATPKSSVHSRRAVLCRGAQALPGTGQELYAPGGVRHRGRRWTKRPELAALAPVPVAPHVAEKLAGTKSSQGVFVLFATPRPDPSDLLDTPPGASWRWRGCRTPATWGRCCAAPRPSALTPWCWGRAVPRPSRPRRCAPPWGRRGGCRWCIPGRPARDA